MSFSQKERCRNGKQCEIIGMSHSGLCFELMDALDAFRCFQIAQKDGQCRTIPSTVLIASTEHGSIGELIFDSLVLNQNQLGRLQIETTRGSLPIVSHVCREGEKMTVR